MGPTAPAITGLILAGGRGSRMGGVDKGLQNFRGQSLAQQTLVRLQQQSLPPQDILINANRNLAAYQSLGVPVWPDSLDGFAGPLAGFLTGLEHCQTPLLLTVPCDSPLFPLDLVQRLCKPWRIKTPTWPWLPPLKSMALCARNPCFACSKPSYSKA